MSLPRKYEDCSAVKRYILGGISFASRFRSGLFGFNSIEFGSLICFVPSMTTSISSPPSSPPGQRDNIIRRMNHLEKRVKVTITVIPTEPVLKSHSCHIASVWTKCIPVNILHTLNQYVMSELCICRSIDQIYIVQEVFNWFWNFRLEQSWIERLSRRGCSNFLW